MKPVGARRNARRNRGFMIGELGQASVAPTDAVPGALEQADTAAATGFRLRRRRRFESLGQMAVVECKFEFSPGPAEALEEQVARLADAPKSGAFERHGHYFDFKEKFFDIGNWTSSFFTGMALLAVAAALRRMRRPATQRA